MNLKVSWRLSLKKLAIVVLSLFFIGTLLLVIERVRGAFVLENRITELVYRGEQFKIAKLEPIHPKPSQDAAAALTNLISRLDPATSNLFALLPPLGHFAAPGKAVVSSKLTHWANPVNKKTTNTWAPLHNRLGKDPTLPDAIHAALLRPGWNDGFDYHKGFVDFPYLPFATWKQTATYLEARALAAVHENDRSLAVDRVEDMLSLVRHQGNSSMIITELVRIACATISWHTCWEIVVSDPIDEAQLARLQAGWEALDFSTNMIHAMEMERAMTMDQFEQVLTSPETLEKAVKLRGSLHQIGLGSEWPLSGQLRWVHLTVWRFAWARQDQLRSLNRWQEVIEFDRQAHLKPWAGLRDQAATLDRRMNWSFDPGNFAPPQPKPNWYDRWRFLFSEMSYGTDSRTTRRALEMETQRRLMIVAIALRRYQLRHGAFPERLEDLRPGLLASVPTDPMDGMPLRYRRLPDGPPLLYSVGVDGQDDGGDASLPNGDRQSLGVWSGKDAVWPAPASAVEAEKAVNELPTQP